jgi:tRNA threonylcarbamoyladenosine biosynthesis protein TsaB
VRAGWILGFDTATRATAVALADASGRVREARDDPPLGERPRHAARLLPLCTELLDQAGIGYRDLDRLAVGVGPGTFTGLRIGVATGRALAQASAIPLVAVPTLRSLALNVLTDGPEPKADVVAAVLDARRGEAFAAAWRIDPAEPPGEPVLDAGAYTPESLVASLTRLEGHVLAIGEGAVAFREVLERSGAFVPGDETALHRVTAAGHCLIARHEAGTDPSQVTPQYLRLPDAEIVRRAKGQQ